MSVKQFSAIYSPVEDRIVFGFNTTEGELYQFLLTRAITKSLLDQCESSVEQSLTSQHNERSCKLISEFQRETLRKQIDFQETFEGGQITPLGKDPILLTQVKLRLQKDHVHISMILISNQVVGFTLLIAQLQALILLIERLAAQAGWKITSQDSSDIGVVQPIGQISSSQIH